MKSANWKQNVLLVSKDHEFKSKIASAFFSETQLLQASDKVSASEISKSHELKVLIIDTESLKNGKGPDSHQEYISLCSDILGKSQKLVTILFANKPPSDEILKALDSLGIHGFLDRRDFHIGTLQFLIRAFRYRNFRTIALDDFSNDFIAPKTLYHFLPKNNRYVPIFPKNTQYSDRIRTKMIQGNTFQIYSKQEDYQEILNALMAANSKRELISVHLNIVRDLYIKYLSYFFNFSKDSSIQNGKNIYSQGEKIISRLIEVIDIFPSPIDCIQQLPYKRWSDISHSLNCAIFALIFGKYLKIKKYQDVAHAALYHNIGISQINQMVATKSPHDFSITDKIEYQKHVEHSIHLLKRLRLPLKLWHYAVVYQHHECFDGTGYPKGASGDKILPQAQLLSLCGAFNHTLAISNGNHTKNISEAWNILKSQENCESLQTKQAYSPELINKLDAFFNTRQKKNNEQLTQEILNSKESA